MAVRPDQLAPLHLDHVPVDVLRDLFCSMHGVPAPEGQSPIPAATKLYETVAAELVTRIELDEKAREIKRPGFYYEGVEHDGKQWVIVLVGVDHKMTKVFDGTKEEAAADGVTTAKQHGYKSFFVVPLIVAAEVQL